MASPSPGRRLRTKTSDIAIFFRAGDTSRSRATADGDDPAPPIAISEPESPVLKRSSKIPFLGRQRKRSTHSDASTPALSAGPSIRQLQSDPDVRFNTNSPSPSLGFKLLAAHFPPSQKFLNLSPRTPARPPINELSDPSSLPIPASRETSLHSTSSDKHSATPRPQPQPDRMPPDDLEGYYDMFTLPIANIVEDPQLTPTPSLHLPTPQPSDSQSQSRDLDAFVILRSSRSTQEANRVSRISRKHVGSPARRLELETTDAEDYEAIMSDPPKSSPPMSGPTPLAENRRTLATMPHTQPRSIMKHSSDRPPRPPAFPPPPPPTYPPSPALPAAPSQTAVSRKLNGSPPLGSSASRRQRAQTLAAVPPTFPSASSSLPSTLASLLAKSIIDGRAPAALATEDPTGKVNSDIEKASVDQLRQALTLRNQQFDELASYLLEILETYVAEKHALLKKVASLEQEATREENEIKGLTWLVTNNPWPGLGMMSNAASKSMSALELEPGADKQSSGVESTFSHFNPAEDSGAEPHQTMSGAESESHRESGPESIWGSGASGGESSSSSQGRKVKRNHRLTSSFYRSPAKSTRGAEASAPATLPYSLSTSTKRSSLSSFGTSPSSSTSSLSLGTLTPAATVTSLSAISTRSQDPVVAAAILATGAQRGKEERRAIRVSDHLSESSASASYAANSKRARPSIAQVLAQSPKVEHGWDKLRSYGTSGSASS